MPSPIEKVSKTRINIFYVESKQIHVVQKFNPREDFGDLDSLARQIVARGGIQRPLEVAYNATENRHDLIDGERRLKALAIAIEKHGLTGKAKLVPVKLVGREHKPKDSVLATLIANDGKPLNILEQATAIKRLHDEHGMKPDEIAAQIGKSRPHVTACLKLVDDAAPELRQEIKKGTLSSTMALDIIKECPTADAQRQWLAQAKEAATKAGAQKITAKHSPIATGKKASSARSQAKAHKQEEEDDQNTGTTLKGQAKIKSGSSPGVPFKNVVPDEAETGSDGTFISKIQEEPIAFSGRGVAASVLLVEKGGKIYYGYLVKWPGTKPGDGYYRLSPSLKGEQADTLTNARLLALSRIRADLDGKETVKNKPQVLQDVDDVIKKHSPGVPLSTPQAPAPSVNPAAAAPQPGAGLLGRGPDPTPAVPLPGNPVLPVVGKNPVTELADMLKSIAKADAEKERYDTAAAILKVLQGKADFRALSRFIVGIENKV